MTRLDSADLTHKRELLETYRKNLHRQEKTAAEHGLNVPLSLANEIEFLKQEIARLTQELEACRPQLYQEALAQQEMALTDRPAVLALGLGTDISGRVLLRFSFTEYLMCPLNSTTPSPSPNRCGSNQFDLPPHL